MNTQQILTPATPLTQDTTNDDGDDSEGGEEQNDLLSPDGEAEMDPPSGDHDGLHNDTSVHERQSVEEAHDMQKLLKEPTILLQLNQVTNDDDGEVVEEQNN